ncbi:unnamed protein product, partial [Allacma fusca]
NDRPSDYEKESKRGNLGDWKVKCLDRSRNKLQQDLLEPRKMGRPTNDRPYPMHHPIQKHLRTVGRKIRDCYTELDAWNPCTICKQSLEVG